MSSSNLQFNSVRGWFVSLFFSIILLFSIFPIYADENRAKLCQISGESELYSPVFLLSLGIKTQVQANHSNSRNVNHIISLHKKAIQYFQQYINCAKENKIPISSSTYYLKASSHFEIKEWAESLSDVDSSLAIANNQYKDALILKSRLLIKQNKFKQPERWD